MAATSPCLPLEVSSAKPGRLSFRFFALAISLPNHSPSSATLFPSLSLERCRPTFVVVTRLQILPFYVTICRCRYITFDTVCFPFFLFILFNVDKPSGWSRLLVLHVRVGLPVCSFYRTSVYRLVAFRREAFPRFTPLDPRETNRFVHRRINSRDPLHVVKFSELESTIRSIECGAVSRLTSLRDSVTRRGSIGSYPFDV